MPLIIRISILDIRHVKQWRIGPNGERFLGFLFLYVTLWIRYLDRLLFINEATDHL